MSVDARARTAAEVAADTVWLLLLHGSIDRRRWRGAELAETVGITVEDLDAARLRCEAHGFESLRAGQSTLGTSPFAPGETPCPDPSAHEPRPPRAAPAGANPGERRCPRCNERFPVEQFPASPLRRRGQLCEICIGELERDVFVAVRKAKPLHQVIAWFTAIRGDAVVGMTCGKCHEPFKLGDQVAVQGQPEHRRCPPKARK